MLSTKIAATDKGTIGNKAKRRFKALVSMVTAVAFLSNTLMYDSALASQVSARYAQDHSGTGAKNGYDELGADNFSIPDFLGEIKSRHDSAGSGTMVVHIQDAHCNYDCQKAISGIISYIQENYGINTVNLEGGDGLYDLSVFTDIQDAPVREKVADYFVNEGILSGAEYFSAVFPEKTELWGIEDPGLYAANRDVYRSSLKNIAAVNSALSVIHTQLNALKDSTYSDDLKDLDKKYGEYKSGEMDLKDYLSFLFLRGDERGVDRGAYPNISSLYETAEQEKNIDFRAANSQRHLLIDRMGRNLPPKIVGELGVKTLKFRSGEISQTEFYEFLSKMSLRAGISLSEFPELEKYIKYVSLYDSIDKSAVISEMSSLEEDLCRRFSSGEKDRELWEISRNLTFLENMFATRLTREEYSRYKSGPEDFSAARITAFIEKENPAGKLEIRLASAAAEIDRQKDEISGFYEYSFKRDDVFLEKMKFSSRGEGGKRRYAMLVTGGFHSENLGEIFRKKGFSYVAVMPKFRNCEGYESPYYRLLGGEESPVIAAIKQNASASASALALYGFFCATSGEVNGDADVNAVKTWVKLVTAVFSQDLSDGPVDVDGAYRVSEASSDESDDAAGIVLDVDGRKVIVTYLSSAQESAADGRLSRRNFLKMLGIGAATAIIPVRSEAEEEPTREEKESQISEYLMSGSLDGIKISEQYLSKVKEFISDRVFSDIPTIYSESQLPPWFLFRHYCALEFGETGTSAPGKSGLHVSKANAHGPIQMWTDQAVQLNKNLTTWRTSKRSKDSPRDREKLKALEESFAKFGFNIDKGIEVARIKKDAKYSVAMAVANLRLIFMDWERFFEKGADPVERNVMERQKRFYTLSLVALHNSSPITVKLAIQNGGEAWVEKLRDETIGLMWRFCVFLKAVNTDPDVAALFAEIDPQINIPEDAFLSGEESPVPLMATRELEPVNFDEIMSRVDEAAYAKEKQSSNKVNELTMKSFGIFDLVIYALAGAGAAVISRRMLFPLKNNTHATKERTMQDKSIDMVARVFAEYGKEISYEEAKFVWLAMQEDLRIGGMDDSPLAVQRGLVRLISEMSPDGFLDAFTEEYGTPESPAERLLNSLRNIFSPGREGSDSDDVNIAAGGSIKVTHTDVNKFVGDNLPRGLWGESLEERAENLDNLVEEGTAKVRVTDDGTEVVLIPIKGLFRACGQFGHIGLGRAYGRPVAWIDSDYMDNDIVIGHELYEIDRWEQHRKTLGYDPDMMRGWIRANFDQARKLAVTWHNDNKYSVEDLFLENKTGVQVERLDSILTRMKVFYSGEKFKEYMRSLAVKYAENGLELVNIDGLEGELLSRIEEIISGVDLKVLSESRSPIGIRGSTIEVLLAYAEYMSDEELAIVLGHEVGHELADIFLPELSPDAKFLRQAAALPTDLAIIGEDGEFLSIIHQVYRHGGKKRESAENEIQQRELFSDEIGIFLAGAILPAELRIRAGEIAGDVLNKTSEFIDNNLKDDSGSGFLSVRTHPSIEARAANLGFGLGIKTAVMLTGVDPLKEVAGEDKADEISGSYPLRDLLSIFVETYGTDFDPQEIDRDVNLAAGPGTGVSPLRKKPLLGVILDHVKTLGHKPGDEIIVGFTSDGIPIKGIFRGMDEYGEEIIFSPTGFNFGAILGKNKVLSSERYLLFNRYAENGSLIIGGKKHSLSGLDFGHEKFPEIEGMSLREVLRYMAIAEEGGWYAWDYPLVSGYDLATKNETEEDKRSLAGRPRGGMAFYSLKEGRLVTYMYTSVEVPNGKGVEWRIARIESGKPLPQNETAAPSYLVNGIRDVEDMGQENFENFFDMYCLTDSWDRSLIRAMAAVLRGEKDAEKLKNLLRPFDKWGDEVRVSPEDVRAYMEARAEYTALRGDDDKRRTGFYSARSFLMGLYDETEKSENYFRYFGAVKDSAMNKLASLDDVLRRYSSVRFPSEKEVSPEVQKTAGEVKSGDSISFGSETFVLEFKGGKYLIAGKVLEDGGTYSVGRGSENYIRVLNGSVSREHAVIKVYDGKVFIEDKSSMNGTFVNGKKIASPTESKPGQRKEAASSSRVYAVFNNWQKGLVNIAGSMDEVKAHNYDDTSMFHIVPVDVPQDVYVGAHQSSIISARAAADIDNVKPGSRVLVIGTGMGLEAYIAMGRGAHVDAVDINPSALKSTENLCGKLPPEGRGSLRTFLYDVMPGGIRENALADEYDLIIFNMPHYAAPTSGDDKEITATRDPGGQLIGPTSEIVKTRLASGGRAVLVNTEGENVRKTLESQIGLTVFPDPIYGMDPSMAYVVENGNNAILNDLIDLLGIDVSRNFGVRKQLVALAELIRRKQLAAGGVSVPEVTEGDLAGINIPDIIVKVNRLNGKTLGMLGMGGMMPGAAKAQSLMVNLLSGRAPVTNMFLRAWGVVSTPFHEFAHYLAALMFGANPKLSVSGLFTGEITIDRAPPSKAATYLIYSAGLLANLALAGASAYYLLNYGQTVSVFAWVLLTWVAAANAASAIIELVGAPFGKGDLAKARARRVDDSEVFKGDVKELVLDTRVLGLIKFMNESSGFLKLDHPIVSKLQEYVDRMTGQGMRAPRLLIAIDGESPDAFRVPGNIVINLALIRALDTLGEVVSVIAHELGHEEAPEKVFNNIGSGRMHELSADHDAVEKVTAMDFPSNSMENALRKIIKPRSFQDAVHGSLSHRIVPILAGWALNDLEARYGALSRDEQSIPDTWKFGIQKSVYEKLIYGNPNREFYRALEGASFDLVKDTLEKIMKDSPLGEYSDTPKRGEHVLSEKVLAMLNRMNAILEDTAIKEGLGDDERNAIFLGATKVMNEPVFRPPYSDKGIAYFEDSAKWKYTLIARGDHKKATKSERAITAIMRSRIEQYLKTLDPLNLRGEITAKHFASPVYFSPSAHSIELMIHDKEIAKNIFGVGYISEESPIFISNMISFLEKFNGEMSGYERQSIVGGIFIRFIELYWERKAWTFSRDNVLELISQLRESFKLVEGNSLFGKFYSEISTEGWDYNRFFKYIAPESGVVGKEEYERLLFGRKDENYERLMDCFRNRDEDAFMEVLRISGVYKTLKYLSKEDYPGTAEIFAADGNLPAWVVSVLEKRWEDIDEYSFGEIKALLSSSHVPMINDLVELYKAVEPPIAKIISASQIIAGLPVDDHVENYLSMSKEFLDSASVSAAISSMSVENQGLLFAGLAAIFRGKFDFFYELEVERYGAVDDYLKMQAWTDYIKLTQEKLKLEPSLEGLVNTYDLFVRLTYANFYGYHRYDDMLYAGLSEYSSGWMSEINQVFYESLLRLSDEALDVTKDQDLAVKYYLDIMDRFPASETKRGILDILARRLVDKLDEAHLSMFFERLSSKGHLSKNVYSYFVSKRINTFEDSEKMSKFIRDRYARMLSGEDIIPAFIAGMDTGGDQALSPETASDIFSAAMLSGKDEKVLWEALETHWYQIYVGGAKRLLYSFEVRDGRIEVVGLGRDNFVPLKTFVDSVLDMSENSKLALMERLLVSPNGLLHHESGRKRFVELIRENIPGSDSLSAILKEAVGSVVDNVDAERVFMMFRDVIRPFFLRRQEGFTVEGEFLKMLALRNISRVDEDNYINEDSVTRNLNGLSPEVFMSLIRGDIERAPLAARINYSKTRNDFLSRFGEKLGVGSLPESEVPPSDAGALDILILAAESLGPMGVRSLQVMGQYMDIPAEYETRFREVYDSNEGIDKFIAFDILKKSAERDPGVKYFLENELVSIGDKLGGGSIMTAFLIKVKDPATGKIRDEVLKVRAPNAEVRVDDTYEKLIRVVRDMKTRATASKKANYEIAERLLSDIRDWIRDDINDETFLELDQKYAEFHKNYRDSRGTRVRIPGAFSPNNRDVKREELVRGETLNSLLREGRGEILKPAVQAVVEDFARTLVNPVFNDSDGEEVFLLHSDIHFGNAMVEQKDPASTEDLTVALIDRNLYLRLTRKEVDFMRSLLLAENTSDIAHLSNVIKYFAGDLSGARQLAITASIARKIKMGGVKSGIGALAIILKEFEFNSIHVPIRMRILFKNLSAIETMLRTVDGGEFRDYLKTVIDLEREVSAEKETASKSFHMSDEALAAFRIEMLERIKAGNKMTIDDAIGYLESEKVPDYSPIMIALGNAKTKDLTREDDINSLMEGLSEEEEVALAILIQPRQGGGETGDTGIVGEMQEASPVPEDVHVEKEIEAMSSEAARENNAYNYTVCLELIAGDYHANIPLTAINTNLDGSVRDAELSTKTLVGVLNIQDDRSKYLSLQEITRACPLLRDTSQAGNVLTEALSIARNIQDDYYKSLSLQEIAKAYVLLKDYSRAGEILPEALSVALNILSDRSRSVSLREIARVYMTIGVDAGRLSVLRGQFENVRRLAEETFMDPNIAGQIIATLFKEKISPASINNESDIVDLFWKINDPAEKKIFLEKVIQPAFFKNRSLFTQDVLEKLQTLYLRDVPGTKHILFWANMKRDAPSLYLDEVFSLHGSVESILKKGKKRVLVGHNVYDGQGDELIINAPLIQALLDYNPELEVTIITLRPYLYSHPRIHVHDIGKEDVVTDRFFDMVADRPFDMVIEEFDSLPGSIKTGASLFLDIEIGSMWGYRPHHVERGVQKYHVEIEAQKYVIQIDADNVYTPGMELMAEFGLTFRAGIEKTQSGCIFTSTPYQIAEDYWENKVLPAAKGAKEIVVFNGFGGMLEEKGFARTSEGREQFREALTALIGSGRFVVILPNDQDWGTVEVANTMINSLSPEAKKFCMIAPSPIEDPLLHKYLVSKADRVVTVEGGLMHLAYNMGKPYVVLFAQDPDTIRRWAPVSASNEQKAYVSNLSPAAIIDSYLKNVPHLAPAIGTAEPETGIVVAMSGEKVPVVAEEAPEEREAREFIEANADFAAAIAPYRYLTDRYGYRPWKELYDAAGPIKYGHFVQVIPELAKIFTKEKLIEYWPDIVEIGKTASFNVPLLFSSILPGLKSAFGTEYLSDILRLGKEGGSNGYHVLDAILKLEEIITTRDELNKVGSDLLELSKTSGKKGWHLLGTGISAVTKTFAVKELKNRWPDLVNMGKAAGVDAGNLFEYGIPMVAKVFTAKEMDRGWHYLSKIAIDAGPASLYLFAKVVPALREYLVAKWEDEGSFEMPLHEVAAVLYAEEKGQDFEFELSARSDEESLARIASLALKFLDDKKDLHLRYLVYTGKYDEVKKLFDAGESSPSEIADMALAVRQADIASYATELAFSGKDRVKTDNYGNMMPLPYLVPLSDRIEVRAVRKEELINDLSSFGVKKPSEALDEALARGGMTVKNTADGDVIVPVVLDTVLSGYRGSRSVDHVKSTYLTYAITTVLFKYAKDGGAQASSGEKGERASGFTAVHEFDVNLMNLAGMTERSTDDYVARAFYYGEGMSLPEYARKRNMENYPFTPREQLAELMRYQRNERRAKQNIRQIFEWLSSGSLSDVEVASAIDAMRRELAVLDPWSGTCGLNEDYFDAVYGYLDGRFFEDLTTEYKPGSDNKVIINGRLKDAMSRHKVLVTRAVGEAPEVRSDHPWLATGITLIDYLENEEVILKGTPSYADLRTMRTPADLAPAPATGAADPETHVIGAMDEEEPEPAALAEKSGSHMPAGTDKLWVDGRLNSSGILLMHALNHFPEDGRLYPNSYFGDEPVLMRNPRNIVEFSFNNIIHYWMEATYIVIIPMTAMLDRQWVNIWYTATSHMGPVSLPKGTTIMVRRGREISEQQIEALKAKGISIVYFDEKGWADYEAVNVVKGMGYEPVTIFGGPFGGTDTSWKSEKTDMDYGSKENMPQLKQAIGQLAEELHIASAEPTSEYDIGYLTISMELLHSAFFGGDPNRPSVDWDEFNSCHERVLRDGRFSGTEAWTRFMMFVKFYRDIYRIYTLGNMKYQHALFWVNPDYIEFAIENDPEEVEEALVLRGRMLQEFNKLFDINISESDLASEEDFKKVAALAAEKRSQDEAGLLASAPTASGDRVETAAAADGATDIIGAMLGDAEPSALPDTYSYFANDPIGKDIPREVIEAGITATGRGGLSFGFANSSGEIQLKALSNSFKELIARKRSTGERTLVIRQIGPGDGSEAVSILRRLDDLIGYDPQGKWEVIIDVVDNNESILAEAEETLGAEMAGFENITCNVRYSKADVFDAAGLNALRTTGAAGSTDYIIFRNVLNIKQHIDRGDFELKDMAASFIALRNLIENFAGEDTKLVMEPYPIQPQDGLLANGILDAGDIKSFQEDNGFSNFLNLFGASDMMHIGISTASPAEEFPAEIKNEAKNILEARIEALKADPAQISMLMENIRAASVRGRMDFGTIADMVKDFYLITSRVPLPEIEGGREPGILEYESAGGTVRFFDVNIGTMEPDGKVLLAPELSSGDIGMVVRNSEDYFRNNKGRIADMAAARSLEAARSFMSLGEDREEERKSALEGMWRDIVEESNSSDEIWCLGAVSRLSALLAIHKYLESEMGVILPSYYRFVTDTGSFEGQVKDKGQSSPIGILGEKVGFAVGVSKGDIENMLKSGTLAHPETGDLIELTERDKDRLSRLISGAEKDVYVISYADLSREKLEDMLPNLGKYIVSSFEPRAAEIAEEVIQEDPADRTDGEGMSRRGFLKGVGAIALTAAMDTAALDVESFLAEATPEELAEKLLTRDNIDETSFEKMTNEYEYLTQAFSNTNFREFSRHKPSEKEISFLAGLIRHCQKVDTEKLNKLLGAVENVIIIENGPHDGGAGFGVFSNNSVVLEFDSDLPTLSEVSTPIYAGLLIHEAAHVEGARKEVPIEGILSEIYARLEVLDWKGVGANSQSWIDEEQYMVDMITLGIEKVKAEKSIAGTKVTRHDMEKSEAGKVWDYYWANGVTRMEAVRFMGAARGLLMMEGYADSEVKYISGTDKLRPDTKEREKGQPVKGYWIAFDLGGGKTAEIFSGVDEKGVLYVFYEGEWTKLSFKLEEAKAKMGRGFDGIGELTVAASAKWYKGMKDDKEEQEEREALSPSLDLEELTAALDTNPAMDVREFHKATDSFISTRSNGLYDLFNNADQDIRRAELERIVRRKYAGKYMGEIPAHILKDKNGKDVVSREGDRILVVARGMLKPFSLFARVENEKPLPGLSVIWVDTAFYGNEELENLILSGNPAERSEDVLGGLYRTLPDSLKNEIGQARINRIFDRIHTAAQTHLNEYYSMRAHPDVAAPKKEKERELPILTVKVNSDGKLAFAQGWMNTIQFRIDMHEWSSEDELAFVVAHECDHIWRDKDFDHDNFGLMVAAQIMADEGGVHLMKWAGFDPDGAIEAFDKWVDTEANRTRAPEKSLGEISARKAALRSAVETFKDISSDSEMKDSSGDEVEILSRSGSLIGKVEVEVDGKLKVLTDGFAAREVTRDGKKMLSVSHAELAEDIAVGLGEEVEDAGAVNSAVSSLLSGAKFLNAGYDAELKQLMEEKLLNITRIVALEPNENIVGFFSDNTLYVNESLLADNMALIHELGESLAEGFIASITAEYPGINMHTYMRGAGKDVHRAYSALKDPASILKESGARGLIDAINVKMKELTGRPEMSPAEEALILLNASQRGTAVSPDKDPTRGLLFGFQDRLDPSGNVRLSKHIGQVLNDMNRGALNIMVLPAGDIMSEAAKKSAGRQASRTLERKFGTNTRVYSFTSDIVSSIKTAMAEAEKAMENTQEKVYPKIFVNCVSLEQKNNEVMPYLETLSPDARNMIVVNYENIPDAERSTIDEVAMIMVGSAILNDHRLSVDFKLPKEALSEGRKNMITAFSEAGIIEIEENDDLATAEGLDSIMQKFYTGQRPLTINKINWQELRDYQDSMDLILKSA